MRRLVVLLVACSSLAAAQTPQIKLGATLYIEPMDGYEMYLAAALVKARVPLLLVTEEGSAEYIMRGGVVHNEPSQPEVVVNNTASATVSVGGEQKGNQQAFARGWASGERAAERSAAAKAALGYSTASISIVDPRSRQIVFAYSTGRDGKNQGQKTAEDCAKNLKKLLEKVAKAH